MQPYYLPKAIGPSSTMTLTTTLTNIPGMSVNLVAGGWYLVSGWVRFAVTTTSGTTVGIALGGTVGAVAPTMYSIRTRNGATDGTNTQVSAVIPGLGSASNNITAAATYATIIDGLVVAGTAGTLTAMAVLGGTPTPAANIPANGAAMLVQQIA